ncbi:HAD family hydrolase [Candidatus Daviesbacteria bacterium]|nr:HAD family hydrolase [Candidatus Daviesbacteria bacterium]
MIKLVAFDWNGTVFSDTYAVLDSVNQLLKSLELKRITLAKFQKYFDVPVEKAYFEFGISKEVLRKQKYFITHNFHINYEPRAAKVRTRAFARFLLRWLVDNNVKSIIFSNHLDEPIRKQLKRLKIDKYFSAVLANLNEETVFESRAKEKRLKRYIKDNHLSGNQIIVIGDTVEEVEIGKTVGAVTLGLTHGFCSIARLKAARPDYLISSLKEVINIIKKS